MFEGAITGSLCLAAREVINSTRVVVAVGALAVTISPPFGARAKPAMKRSISPCTLIGLASIPIEGATDWITANCPIPAVVVGSQMTATRFTLGAISLSSSGHLALRLYSNCTKPVALPPGSARLSTMPEPTGSGTSANTIGMVRVA